MFPILSREACAPTNLLLGDKIRAGQVCNMTHHIGILRFVGEGVCEGSSAYLARAPNSPPSLKGRPLYMCEKEAAASRSRKSISAE